MNLNVRYLEEFVTLTEKKNFLEAAECLFISQSCLSKHQISYKHAYSSLYDNVR